MIRHPFENVETEPEEPELIRCPDCGSIKGFTYVNAVYSHCLGCNALVKTEDITAHISKKET